MDASAPSTQGNLAAVFSLARQHPHLRFRAIEPGVNPGSNLGTDASAAVHLLAKVLAPALSLLPHFTTSARAGRVAATQGPSSGHAPTRQALTECRALPRADPAEPRPITDQSSAAAHRRPAHLHTRTARPTAGRSIG